MVKFIRFNIALLLLTAVLLKGQILQNEGWVNGFGKYSAGENLAYHSCHPDANLALLIRCYNNNDFIEWESDSIPSNFKSEFITFVWIAGYSTATSTAPHTFQLSVNNKPYFRFRTSPTDPKSDWSVSNENGSALNFRFAKVDPVDDFFGYMHLTIPKKELDGRRTVKIKITGDASNSKDWYMTMQYPLVPKIRITPEKVVSKDDSGRLMQRVKVSIDHFEFPQPVKIFSGGKEVCSSALNLGMNDFFINYNAPKSKAVKKIDININGKRSSHFTTINPARKITFYLIPHAHVDIGYTELQTEVEIKHWKNFDNAIEYSKRSSSYPAGSVFKWNVEVLWAVKSYLENFPEKRAAFFDAVKKGWIGLDATYVNVMTALCRPEELYRLVDYSNQLEKEIGTKIESAMISDIPGYAWGTVQAFADNGIKYFSVGPNEFDRIGNTLKVWGDKPFYWKSQSGKEKILIWLAGKGYSWFHRWRLTRDDFSPLAKYLDELDAKNYPYDMVHMRYNIGGDNGFPDSTLSGYVKEWNESHETPKFKIATNEEMFKDFESRYKKIIPTFSGDFTPYWEDGAGSTAKETAINRNSAELLTQLESLYTLTDPQNFPQKEFDEAWRYVLLFSEHTWGAWNSISDPEIKFVTDQWEIKKSYAVRADSIARNLYRKFTGKNTSGEKPVEYFSVFNTSSWIRKDIARIPAGTHTAGSFILDGEGSQIPSQRLSNGDLVFIAENIPPLSSKQFRLVKADPVQLPADGINENEILSPKNVWKDVIASFIDKDNKYGLNGYIFSGQNAKNPQMASAEKVSAEEKGPVVNSFRFESEALGCNKLLREVFTFPRLDKVEIVNTLDKKKNYEKENIRFAFPFNIENPTTRIDLAWSVIRPEKDQLAGANKNYFTAQRWVDVSNDQRGITLATIDAPFIEVGGMNAESWLASPDKDWSDRTSSSSTIYSWAMNNSWHTNFKASQEGMTVFKYSLLPHNKFSYSESYRFGVEQSQPLQFVIDQAPRESTPATIKLDEKSAIAVTSFRPARDRNGYLVRLCNPTDKSEITRITWNGKTGGTIYISNGDEGETRRIDGRIELKPFEVVTLKIVVKN